MTNVFNNILYDSKDSTSKGASTLKKNSKSTIKAESREMKISIEEHYALKKKRMERATSYGSNNINASTPTNKQTSKFHKYNNTKVNFFNKTVIDNSN
jgi:hypothetical protein